ncbi:MAG: diaminopimelate epimerase, partial [Alistipes sp.]|nr:diaminopimelate epimerase [Alistipes sp.]
MKIRFSKYEGAGNDFILIELRDGGTAPSRETIARLCDRHFGVGADGLLTLSAPTAAGCDCSMRYY